MELDIDFTIAAKYGERHDSYSQNLKIFRSFIRVYEAFFKKEKYQNAEIKVDDEAKNKATIGFCGKKYRIALTVDPTDPKSAMIMLTKMERDNLVHLGTTAVVDPEKVIFPDNQPVSLRDTYEFNNAVLKFFIEGISRRPGSG